MATRTEKIGDDYVLTGEKASITFTGLADAAIIMARTGDTGHWSQLNRNG